MISYAQNFEDVILERIFKNVDSGFYVDIGAGHPVYDSVTQHFYNKNWCGINVEPQPSLFNELLKQRERDLNLNFCIGNRAGRQTLHITSDLGTSTLDSTLAASYRKAGTLSQEIEVDVLPLNEIVNHHASGRDIEFLKIDVEGYEKKVLEGTDFTQVSPKIIIIESVHPATHVLNHQEWEHYLIKYYQFCYFDGLNRFYRRRDINIASSCFNVPPNVFDRFKTLKEHLVEEANGHLKVQNEVLLADAESRLLQVKQLEEMLKQKDGALADASAAYQALRAEFENKLAELRTLVKKQLNGQPQ